MTSPPGSLKKDKTPPSTPRKAIPASSSVTMTSTLDKVPAVTTTSTPPSSAFEGSSTSTASGSVATAASTTTTTTNTTTTTTGTNTLAATSTGLPGSSTLGSALGVSVAAPQRPLRPSIVITVFMPLQGVTAEEQEKHRAETVADGACNITGITGKGKNAGNEDEYIAQDQNVVIDFLRLAEKKYGYEKVHPNAVRSAMELAGDDDMEVEDAEEGDEPAEGPVHSAVAVVSGGASGDSIAAANKRAAQAAAARAKVEGKYDLNDPFIDDSELLWEEQAASTQDGFFVYSGPLVQGEEEAVSGGQAGSGNGGEGDESFYYEGGSGSGGSQPGAPAAGAAAGAAAGTQQQSHQGSSTKKSKSRSSNAHGKSEYNAEETLDEEVIISHATATGGQPRGGDGGAPVGSSSTSQPTQGTKRSRGAAGHDDTGSGGGSGSNGGNGGHKGGRTKKSGSRKSDTKRSHEKNGGVGGSGGSTPSGAAAATGGGGGEM